MTASKMRLTLATRNAHKTRELSDLLGAQFLLEDLSHAPHVPEVDETGLTFEENAGLKAIATSRSIQGYVLADDSGLEVDALGGAPGIYSARYAGVGASDAQNVAKLLRELHPTFAQEQPTAARFRCVLVLAENGERIATATGTVQGQIVFQPRGAAGFGYDPIFVPAGFTETFAELSPATKNCISHRAKAVEALLQQWPKLSQSRTPAIEEPHQALRSPKQP